MSLHTHEIPNIIILKFIHQSACKYDVCVLFSGTNASFESTVRPTSTSTTISPQSYPARPPVVRMMPRLQTSGDLRPSSTKSSTISIGSSVLQVSPHESQLSIPQFDPPRMPIAMPQPSSSNPAIVSSLLPITNSQISNILASSTPKSSVPNIQGMSLSRDVGSESPHTPTSTSPFSSMLATSSETVPSQPSQIQHIVPLSSAVDFTRQVTLTRSLPPITTKPTQPDVQNPTLSLTPQGSFTPTIIAGIVAIALALATMAGCTLIGCIAIIHCKQRPRRANGSAVERDDKDAISMKEDSPEPGETCTQLAT